MTLDDDEIRAHFDDLRAVDASTAPAFSPPVGGTPMPRRRVSGLWWFAAAASVTIAATLLTRRASSEDVDVAAYSSITTWTSPTAGLLHAPSAPAVRSSVFGSVLDIYPDSSR